MVHPVHSVLLDNAYRDYKGCNAAEACNQWEGELGKSAEHGSVYSNMVLLFCVTIWNLALDYLYIAIAT